MSNNNANNKQVDSPSSLSPPSAPVLQESLQDIAMRHLVSRRRPRPDNALVSSPPLSREGLAQLIDEALSIFDDDNLLLNLLDGENNDSSPRNGSGGR